MNKRASVSVVIAIGVVWVLATFLFGLWGKASAADTLTHDLDPAFTDQGIAQSTKDAASVRAFTEELQTKTIPLVAKTLGVSNQDVVDVLSSNYPAIGRVLSTKDNQGKPFADGKPYLVHASDYLDTVTGALKADQDEFHQADAIPASFLPVRAVPVLFLLLGIVAIVAGVLVLSNGALSPLFGRVIGVVGLVVIVVAVGLGLPSKTSALDSLTADFAPVFTEPGPLNISEGQQYLKKVRAADVEIETKLVPDLPGLLGISLEDTVSALQSGSPVVAKALLSNDADNKKVTVLRGIIDRFQALADVVSANRHNFDATASIPASWLPARIVPWLLIVPGLLLVLCGIGMGALAGVGGKTAGARRKEPAYA